ncbi:CPBP family intramembrane glutamic endopeptidase [Methanothermococcus sp.]|uniref:CPBP family intramembrane glutamic endopeptidase n=1 Tax=Methanothermococcus sp. TaxID=2614238 RepID=UPI0025F73ECA|nr:CPBP family intramembrane glutamic endopeptidase [Methanothermococcus sp.]
MTDIILSSFLIICALYLHNMSSLINIIFSFFAVISYLANLVEALSNEKFEDISIKLTILFNICMFASLFYLNIYYIYKFVVILIISLSIILLVNKNIFNLFVKKLNMNLQWNRITHRIFFPLSLYVLLNPIGYVTTAGNHLMILLYGFFQLMDQLSFHVLMFLYSFIGVGFGTRRGIYKCLNRLGIYIPNIKYVILGFVAVYLIDYIIWNVPLYISKLVYLIAPNIGIDINTKMAVESSNVERVVQSINQMAPSLTNIIFLSFIVGLSEELLFRGALQPRFGNIYTSLLFTILHFQYFSIVALLDIFLISYMLGIIRQKTNTSTTALIHTIYDFVSLTGLF